MKGLSSDTGNSPFRQSQNTEGSHLHESLGVFTVMIDARDSAFHSTLKVKRKTTTTRTARQKAVTTRCLLVSRLARTKSMERKSIKYTVDLRKRRGGWEVF